MSTEDKPLPDFSPIPTVAAQRSAKIKGIPRAPVTAPTSAFSIIETDEVSRTLDFGMSEEDLEDVSDGEGSSSELHDSLRARQGIPGAVEDNFASLSSDYSSGIREEDTYRKPEAKFELPEPEFELPPLDASSATAGAVARSRNSQSLPDFSKFDEVEEVATPVTEETVEPKTKISPKILILIAAVVLVIVVVLVVVLVVLPGSAAVPAVIAPAVDQLAHLLQ